MHFKCTGYSLTHTVYAHTVHRACENNSCLPALRAVNSRRSTVKNELAENQVTVSYNTHKHFADSLFPYP